MKYLSVFLLACVLVFPAQIAFSQGAAKDKPSASQTPRLAACPKKGAEAIQVVDKALLKENSQIAALCLAEVVKDMQARLKALEAAKAR